MYDDVYMYRSSLVRGVRAALSAAASLSAMLLPPPSSRKEEPDSDEGCGDGGEPETLNPDPSTLHRTS